MEKILKKIEEDSLTRDDLIKLLELNDEKDIAALYAKAYDEKLKQVGKKVYFRGIIELSNICDKDCYYCGIRKSNENVERFKIPKEDIITSAIWAYENNYGSIVLQSGELQNDNFTNYIEEILLAIKDKTNGELGVTLSLGEQTDEVYQRWFNAGAHRYLLRIETTNAALYAKLHPENHSFEDRKECLLRLKKLGYQVGTGVMIGLPFQSIENLADDIIFFKENDIDMIGMGPYIPHKETPLASEMPFFDNKTGEKQLEMGLKMIAITRLYLKDVNIAATTALQALHPQGREQGLQAGANIIMPNVTDTKYRASYQLYDNKPCLDENSSMCRSCLSKRVDSIGEEVGFNEWGDSPHFFKRNKNKKI